MIDQEALASIENLHRMKVEGIITEAEFEQSKQKILFGQRSDAPRTPTPLSALYNYTGALPAKDDHVGWATLPLRRYADFRGRSTRREFWMFYLLMIGAFLGCAMVSVPFGGEVAAGLFVIVILACTVPLVAVHVRRFHDQDRSGWLVLITLIPYLGAVLVLVLMALPGTSGDNRFGLSQ